MVFVILIVSRPFQQLLKVVSVTALQVRRDTHEEVHIDSTMSFSLIFSDRRPSPSRYGLGLRRRWR